MATVNDTTHACETHASAITPLINTPTTVDSPKISRVTNYGQPNFTRFLKKQKISERHDSQFIFSLIHVDPVYDDQIRIFDTDVANNLILLHYVNITPEVYHVRGIIIDTERMVIVCQSHPYTPEYIIPDNATNLGNLVPTKQNVRCYVSQEGTVVRLFWHNGQFRFSTHQRIDGRNSKWSGVPFGTIVDELFYKFINEAKSNEQQWPQFLSKLLPTEYASDIVNKNLPFCYTFMAVHPNNRILCDVREARLYCTRAYVSSPEGSGTMKDTDVPASLSEVIPTVINIVTQHTTGEHVLKIFNDSKTTNNMPAPGLMVEYDDWSMERGIYFIKLVSTDYNKLRDIRGNEPDLSERYVQLLCQGNIDSIATFTKLYPDSTSVFKNINRGINKLVDYLAKSYCTRYVYNKFFHLDPVLHYVVKTTKDTYDQNISVNGNIQKTLFDKVEAYRILKLISK
jgi:hypothetical protein